MSLKGSGNLSIDRDAAAILSAATDSVKAILERRRQLDLQGKQDTPLVILAGEVHSMPAHIVYHMAVLKALHDDGQSVLVADENNHNLLSRTFAKFSGAPVTKSQEETLKNADADGHLSLKTFMAFERLYHSDHANYILNRFILRHDMQYKFVDVARRPKDTDKIDRREKSNRASISACFNKAGFEEDLTHADCMKIRNHHMAAKVLEHTQANKPRFIFLRVGAIHALGEKPGYKAKDSVAAFLKGKLPVHAILPDTGIFGEDDIPAKGHGLKRPHITIAKDLPDWEAKYALPKKKERDIEGLTFRFRAAEANWLNAVLPRIGLADETLTPLEHARETKKLQTEVNRTLGTLLAKTRA